MAKLHRINAELLVFFCPACQCGHQVRVAGDVPPAVWSWNGSMDLPSFQPSLRVQFVKEGLDLECHFVVTDGVMHFQGDTSNKEFAGRAVEIPDWEE